MGLKTLLDFRADLQLGLGNRGFTNPVLDNFINTGLGDLTSQVEFEELDSLLSETVTGATNFFTPALVEGIIDLQNVTDDLFMTKVDEAGWNRLDPSITGQPKIYFRRANSILVWPTPDVDTLIEGEKLATHPQLSLDTDITLLQSMWDRAIHLLAMGHGLTDLEEAERSVFFFNSASRYISKRIDLRKVDGRATGVPVQPVDSFEELRRQRTFDKSLI